LTETRWGLQTSWARRSPFSVGSGADDASSDALALAYPVGCQFNPAGRLAGVVFDMADVLYDTTSWCRWLLQLLARMGVQAEYHTFCTAWQRDYLVDVQRGRREFSEAFEAFLFDTGLTWAQIDEVEAASRIRREELERDVRPLPCVAQTLQRLSAGGLCLGILANACCPASKLRDTLARLNIGEFFQSVCSSFDLEATTPSPQCYRAALDALQLDASQVAYVGHCDRALSGAASLGLRTVAFNTRPGSRADVQLTRFAELATIVTAWQRLEPAAASEPHAQQRDAA
jgi:FMN phosphatase YigB (HAD superfamily)